MKITVISDTHRRHSQLNLGTGDILIHAGDIGASSKQNLQNFLGWFEKQRYTHKIFIAGNHDGWMEAYYGETKYIVNGYNCIYLQDDFVTINGINIWGSPWAKEFGGWAFMKTHEQHQRKLLDVDPRTNILVSHGPLYGILDKESRQGILCGSKARIDHLNIDYFICGHIHEAYGEEEKDGIKYINCSVVDRELNVINEPITFEYENKK